MLLRQRLRYLFYYLFLAAGVLFLVVVALSSTIYYLAVSDQERVPGIVEEVCRKSLGAEATFDHYRFQYLDHFPFLSLALENVALRDPCFEDHGRPLLRINKVSAVFRPWKLLSREFEVRSVSVDGADIQFYRLADGYFNASFLEKDSISLFRNVPDTNFVFSLEKLVVKGLSFDFQDELRGKHFRFDLQDSEIDFVSSNSGQGLHLQGDWFFHGLYFKQENGAYLSRQKSQMDLTIEWGGDNGSIRLRPSFAILGKDTLQLEGALTIGDSSHLRLMINSAGILLENARPLLADNLQKSLEPFALSKPVPLTVAIDGPLRSGQPQPMEVNFGLDDVLFVANGLRFTKTSIRGHYSNNCNPSQPITTHSDCLDIKLLGAKLFDTIAVQAHYYAEDMKAPLLKVEAKLGASLAEINHLLPDDRFRFQHGQGELSFSYSGPVAGPLAFSNEQAGMNLQGEGRIWEGELNYLPKGIKFDKISADFSFDEQDLALNKLEFGLDENPYQLSGKGYGLIAALFGNKGRLWASLKLHTPHLNLAAFFDPKREMANHFGSGREQKNAQVRNKVKDIFERLQAEVNVKAEKVSYRKLRATDANFTGRLLRNCPQGKPGPCLLIDSLSAIIFNNIPIKASLVLDEWDNPVVDMALQLDIPLATLNPMLPPGKLQLQGGELALNMHYQGRLNNYSELNEQLFNAPLQGIVSITGGSADYLPRGYKFRDFCGRFHFDTHDLVIDSLDFVLNGNNAKGKGVVKGMLPFVITPGKKLWAVLNITTPELDLNRFSTGQQVLHANNKKPNTPNRITNALEAALEKIEGTLKVKAGKLHFRTMSLDDVAFEGQLLSACEGQVVPNGCLEVGTLSAKLFGTAPFYSTLKISNLEDPFFVADVQVDMPLKELNRMFSPGQFQFSEGGVQVAFHYERPRGHFDMENALLNAHLKGKGHISGGAFEYKPRGYRFSEVDTYFDFDEQDLFIKDIQLQLNDNKIQGSGKFDGFLPFLFLPGRELKTSFEVVAGEFDFGKFKAPQKFLQPSEGMPQEPTVVTELVYAGLENIHADLQLRIDSVKYRNFRATNISGGLTMKPGMMRFENTKMGLCDGAFSLSGRIEGLAENKPDINVRVQFSNTDIQKVFRAFDNFGQEGLTSDNIEGQLNADVSFSARANANYDLLPASMNGKFGLKVENGALLNLPALDSLQGFLLRKRGLSNIQFATMENSFDLNGQDLLVHQFFVASTALSFGVEGRYALGSHSDTNLLFEVPLANLFWQGKEVDALEELHKKKRGPSILLRATESEEGGLSFKWVLSKGK